MLELPRSLVVDDDPAFTRDLCQCLWRHSPEMAVQQVATIDSAVRALGDLRPHIVFLNWSLPGQGDLAMALLQKMSDLMETDHAAAYRHPFFLHRNWTHQNREQWESLQEVTDSLDNPFFGLRDGAPLDTLIGEVYARRIQPRRVLRLTGTFIPVGQCSYIRISDPGGIHFWDVNQDCEVSLGRHRRENFQAISDHLVSSLSAAYPLPGIRSLFVKANERNQWVNLAYAKSIARDEKAALVFDLAGSAGPVNLTERSAQAIARTLEYMKHRSFWPHLSHLNLPG